MATKKQNELKNFFDIHELISKGKDAVREYELPVGTVLIRPLTELEMEECESVLFDEIKDPATRKFAFESAAQKLIDVNEKEIDYNISFTELMRASTQFMIKIVYMSMRDFTGDFDPEDLKKLDGIKDLALEIQRISGYTKETQDEVAEFRKK